MRGISAVLFDLDGTLADCFMRHLPHIGPCSGSPEQGRLFFPEIAAGAKRQNHLQVVLPSITIVIMNVYLVTRNPGKVMAAQSAFEHSGVSLLPVDRDYQEIQAETSIEIARATVVQAAKDYNTPAIREDHSLYVSAFGIPGPYMSFFEKHFPAALLLKVLEGFENRTGYFEIAAAYAKPDGRVKEYVFTVPIVFAREERGTLQSGWNRIIMLQNETRTLAEYPESERTGVWNRNYFAIAKEARALGVHVSDLLK